MEWPNGNTLGNCWCGHTAVDHGPDLVNGHCTQCQCVGYVIDNWATPLGE